MSNYDLYRPSKYKTKTKRQLKPSTPVDDVAENMAQAIKDLKTKIYNVDYTKPSMEYFTSNSAFNAKYVWVDTAGTSVNEPPFAEFVDSDFADDSIDF